jgi:hypothetical protein
VQLLRRQVSMTLQCSPDVLVFVAYDDVLDLQRKLSDPPVITSNTPIRVFFATDATSSIMATDPGRNPRNPPSGNMPHSPYPRATLDPSGQGGFNGSPYPSPGPPLGSTPSRSTGDKLRSSFKCPKFLGEARHFKQWNKGFVRCIAIQQLDHVIDVAFVMAPHFQEDNKLVYYLLEDAVSGSTVATKYVHRAPEWDGHAAYNCLYNGYSFSGPATATLLLSELSNLRFATDESVSELVLRLQEMFEDLESVPGQSAIVFSDTQKVNYLLSAIKHERNLQPVYVQIQTDQLRGRITFDQACDELHYRCETNRADELLNAQVKSTKVRGFLSTGESVSDTSTTGELPYCREVTIAPTPALITITAAKRQNGGNNRRAPKGPVPCLAKGCDATVPPRVRLCRKCYHECIAGKHAKLPLRTGGTATYDPSSNKIVYPESAKAKDKSPTGLTPSIKAHVAFATPSDTAQ